MTAALLVINTERIALADDADVHALIGEITAVLERGGAFVQVTGVHGQLFEVLITRSTHVIVRHGAVTFEAGTAAGPWNTSIDLDI
ncbi:hypothetical protein [Microcella sp.]|uniref:hypothetical protein n=1 Tax=Microcella sp. TaxID=1913979 RepID=UPI00391DCA57